MPKTQHDVLVGEFDCPQCRSRFNLAWAKVEQQRRRGVEQLTVRENLRGALERIGREHAEAVRAWRSGRDDLSRP